MFTDQRGDFFWKYYFLEFEEILILDHDFFSKEIGLNSKGTTKKNHLLRPEATGTNEIFSRYRILTKYKFTMVKPNR